MAAQLPRQSLALTFYLFIILLALQNSKNQSFFFEIRLYQLIVVANFMIHLSER